MDSKRLACLGVVSLAIACGGSSGPGAARPGGAEVEQERCRIEGTGAFDFLLGHWRGTERAIDEAGGEKVVATSDVAATRVLGGCAIEERWTVRDGEKVLFRAVLLRSFDRGTRRWMLSYVDDDLNHQLYEGRPHEGGWAFHRSRETPEGKTVHIRIVWRRSQRGVEQLIERSTDGGVTWTGGAVVELVAVSPEQ